MHKIKRYFIINNFTLFNILLLCGLLLLCSALQPANNVLNINLKNDLIKIKADGFAIVEVKDAAGAPNVGRIITTGNHTGFLTLKGGTASAIKNYLQQNYLAALDSKEVRILIKKLNINESANPNKTTQGNLQTEFGFDLVTGNDLYVHLVDYRGNLKYTRLPNDTSVLEKYLRGSIQNSLQFFGRWLAQHKSNDAVLANSVKVVLEEYTEQPEGDTIYYSAKRPLRWGDFKDRWHNGNYAAEVMPGLGFNENNFVKDGQLIIILQMKVYLPKSAAYVKPGQQNDYNLNHEQRHFDIVEIISNRLKKKLLAMRLPVHNYDGYINVAYFDALREITAMQKLYDLETAHGTDAAQQQKWNSKIDAELSGS